MTTSAKRDLAELSAELLARARATSKPWLDATELCGKPPSDQHRKTIRQLVASGALLALGKQHRHERYRITDGSERGTLVALGRDVLRSRSKARLTLFRAQAAAFKRDTSLPTKVRNALPDALKSMVSEGEAFTVKSPGGESFFLLRADLEPLLGKGSAPTSDGCAPLAPAGAATSLPRSEVAARVRAAYRAMRSETGRNRVLVSDLLSRSQVPLPALHQFLDVECTEHRANPSRGEPTAATEQQLRAALSIAGQPHLYVELFEQAEP